MNSSPSAAAMDMDRDSVALPSDGASVKRARRTSEHGGPRSWRPRAYHAGCCTGPRCPPCCWLAASFGHMRTRWLLSVLLCCLVACLLRLDGVYQVSALVLMMPLLPLVNAR
jgi:hypothetical protein